MLDSNVGFFLLCRMSSNISVAELKRAVTLGERIETLQSELDQILGRMSSTGKIGRPRKGMSAAGRRAIALAQKKRWAKVRKPKRTMSEAARAKISAAAKLRWKKAKAAGQRTL
jgi:hypothetical protein